MYFMRKHIEKITFCLKWYNKDDVYIFKHNQPLTWISETSTYFMISNSFNF
jgi:hypothetical protein